MLKWEDQNRARLRYHLCRFLGKVRKERDRHDHHLAMEEVLTIEQVGFEVVVVTYHHSFLAMCSYSFEAAKSRNRNSLVVASEVTIDGHWVDDLRCTRSGLGCGGGAYCCCALLAALGLAWIHGTPGRAALLAVGVIHRASKLAVISTNVSDICPTYYWAAKHFESGLGIEHATSASMAVVRQGFSV